MDHGSSSEVIDLGGLNAQAGDQFVTFPVLAQAGVPVVGVTQLTVADETRGTSATINLVGDFSSTSFVITADGHGGVNVHDPVPAPTTIEAGETLAVGSSWDAPVTFAADTGTLQLNNPASFTGHITGFAGTAPDAAHSDIIDLTGIDFNSGFSESFNASTGVLTVSGGSNTARLTFENFRGSFHFASDNHGGTLIFDSQTPLAAPTPPASTPPAQGSSDAFVFRPNMGAGTVNNFDLLHDVIEHAPFAGLHDILPSNAVIGTEAWNHLVTGLEHADGVTPHGVMMQQFEAVLAGAVHLH
jgi:hypothetical protein